MPEIEVEAKGDVQSAIDALKKLQTEFGKTATAAAKTDTTVDKAGKTLGSSLKTGANQATNAMTNLGRVIQDAPFGIIGITNNINPLLESFQRLKAETGSTGSAVKALAGSLIGAGGLGFAVSIVTSLLTVFALNHRSSTDATEGHKKKIDETKRAAEEYANAISAASKAVLSHQGKLVDLNRVLSDTSNNFNILSQNILNQALAQFLANQKENLIKQILDAKVKEILATQSAFSKVREFDADLLSKDPLKRQIAEAKADLVNLNNLVRDLNLSNIFKDIFKLDKIKVRPEKFEIDTKHFSELHDVNKVIGPALTLRPDVKIVPNIKSVEITPEANKRILKGLQALLDAEALEKFQKNVSTAINAAVNNIINDTISITADAIGKALAGEKGVLPNLFEGLMTSLGGQIKELGKFMVKTGLEFLALQKALAVLKVHPVATIIAGVALEILGSALQASANKKMQGGFATGVRNLSQGGVFNVGERGPERIFLPAGSSVQPNNELNAFGGGQQVFIPEVRLQGPDLVIAFNRARATMSRNG